MNITDGSVIWRVRDKRIKALVDLFFPVGSIIARDDDTEPEILSYGKWQKIGENRVLQGAGGGNVAGSDVEAGLPNIVGQISDGVISYTKRGDFPVWNGAFGYSGERTLGYAGGDTLGSFTLTFNASKSNPIYGASETVQPPAHIVTFWKRIE